MYKFGARPFLSCMFFCNPFCSIYVISLFSRCSRSLEPGLDSIFHYMYHDHCLSLGFKQSFTTLGCYCLVIYGWSFWLIIFYLLLLHTFSFRCWWKYETTQKLKSMNNKYFMCVTINKMTKGNIVFVITVRINYTRTRQYVRSKC